MAGDAIHLAQEVGEKVPGEGREGKAGRKGFRSLSGRSGVEGLGRTVDHIRREDKGLGRIAQCGTGAVGHYVANHAHVLLAIALIDILDDLLPSIGREIDVDIGHGVHPFTQKTLKEEVVAQRIHLGDLQEIGYQRVGRRTAALAADAALAGKTDNVPDDEKIAGQPHPLDDGQFVGQLRPGPEGDRVEAMAQAPPAQVVQITLRRVTLWYGKRWQALCSKVEADLTPSGDVERVAQRLRQSGIKGDHLRRGLEDLFRVWMQQPCAQRLGQGDLVADASQDIVQPLAVTPGIVDVVGNHQVDPQLSGQRNQRRHQSVIGWQVVRLYFYPEAIGAK